MAYYTQAKILKESVPVLALLVAVGIAAGQLLSTQESALLTLPALLALVVPINASSGMVGAVLGSRVATGLHTGSLLSNGALQFRRDLLAAVVLGAAIFAALAGYGVFVAGVLDREPATLLADLGLVVLGTGAMLVVGMILIVSLLGSLSFRMGWDPDTVVVPSVTTAGDVFGITSFILMVRWVGL